MIQANVNVSKMQILCKVLFRREITQEVEDFLDMLFQKLRALYQKPDASQPRHELLKISPPGLSAS